MDNLYRIIRDTNDLLAMLSSCSARYILDYIIKNKRKEKGYQVYPESIMHVLVKGLLGRLGDLIEYEQKIRENKEQRESDVYDKVIDMICSLTDYIFSLTYKFNDKRVFISLFEILRGSEIDEVKRQLMFYMTVMRKERFEWFASIRAIQYDEPALLFYKKIEELDACTDEKQRKDIKIFLLSEILKNVEKNESWKRGLLSTLVDFMRTRVDEIGYYLSVKSFTNQKELIKCVLDDLKVNKDDKLIKELDYEIKELSTHFIDIDRFKELSERIKGLDNLSEEENCNNVYINLFNQRLAYKLIVARQNCREIYKRKEIDDMLKELINPTTPVGSAYKIINEAITNLNFNVNDEGDNKYILDAARTIVYNRSILGINKLDNEILYRSLISERVREALMLILGLRIGEHRILDEIQSTRGTETIYKIEELKQNISEFQALFNQVEQLVL